MYNDLASHKHPALTSPSLQVDQLDQGANATVHFVEEYWWAVTAVVVFLLVVCALDCVFRACRVGKGVVHVGCALGGAYANVCVAAAYAPAARATSPLRYPRRERFAEYTRGKAVEFFLGRQGAKKRAEVFAQCVLRS